MLTYRMEGPGNKRRRGHGQQPVSFQETFGVKTMYETFNRQAALYLQRQPDDYFVKDEQSGHDVPKRGGEEVSIYERVSEQDFCLSLLEKSKNGDFYPTMYKKGLNDFAGNQRWFGTGNSMQGCPSKLRVTLCTGKYIDLDMQNCGPMILEQLCKKYEIECPSLSDYSQHREDRLAEFSPFLDRAQAKELMIRILNGGSVQEHEREEVDGVDWLPKFIEELHKIHRKIAKEYPEIKGRYTANTPNLDSKVVSAVMYAEENNILEHYYHFFKTTGIIKNGECVLIFDGLMVHDTKSNREHLTTDFLFKASTHVAKSRVQGGYGCVMDHTDLQLTIRIKEFGEGYLLPDDYESVQANFFVIDAGDDQKAAAILRDAAGDRLNKCGSRLFYNHEKCLHREGEKEAKDGIMCLAKEVTIVADIGFGRTAHYSKDTARMNKAIQQLLCDQSIRDDRFVVEMWQSNRGYLNYTNGVYSFKEGRLLTFKEAQGRGIRFTIETGRAYTADVSQTDRDDLMSRIIEGMLPDAEQRKMILSCFARAMAGDIEDKRWMVCMGQRNCSKGIFCKLLENAFGNFVHGTNAENLLVKDGLGQDAAKAQSWVQEWEMKRLVFTNEMKSGKRTMDGDMIKKLCSGGDKIEVRQNYTQENQIQVQITLVICVNDFCEVTPPDAYQSLIGFKIPIEYHEKSDFDELQEQGAEPPSCWRLKDPSINEFIRKPGVIDAFTALIFEAYTLEKMAPPQHVKDDTNSIKGEAAESVEERFSKIIVRGQNTDVLFTKEVQRALEEYGLGTYSGAKIETFVKNVYNITPCQPSRENAQGKNVQAKGFKGLCISDNLYNDKDERLMRTEQVKHSARFNNPNASGQSVCSHAGLDAGGGGDPGHTLPRPLSVEERRVQTMRGNYRRAGVDDPGF